MAKTPTNLAKAPANDGYLYLGSDGYDYDFYAQKGANAIAIQTITEGTISVVTGSGNTLTVESVPAGTYIPIQVQKILEATTANVILLNNRA